MTQKDKELLLKDISARLPYTPKIKITYQQQGVKGTEEGNVSCDFIEKIVSDLRNGIITDMQIYLRPMSSMTEEEIKELCKIDEKRCIFSSRHLTYPLDGEVVDYLNKKMFDYRGLIEKGLAFEAPEEMYNLK